MKPDVNNICLAHNLSCAFTAKHNINTCKYYDYTSHALQIKRGDVLYILYYVEYLFTIYKKNSG